MHMGVLALKMRRGLAFWCIGTLGTTGEAFYAESWHEVCLYYFNTSAEESAQLVSTLFASICTDIHAMQC